MYKTCADCGANLDPCEKCDCGAKKETIKQIFKTAHNETFQNEYAKVYSNLKFKEDLPSCIANDIAETAAAKKAANVMQAALKDYSVILKRR